MKPRVALTLGDPWGIGPEVIAAALARPEVRRACEPVVFGDRSVLARAAGVAGVRLPRDLALVEPRPLAAGRFRFGLPPPDGGALPIAWLEAAVAAVRRGEADALCTGPIHKALVAAAGFRFAGHTDYLAARLKARRAVMLLAGPTLRVALATVHVPLRAVPGLLSVPALVSTLAILDAGLRRHFGVPRPRLAVCGLNPHAGEGGLLGDEEIRVIGPAVARARRRGLRVEGPLPADSLFANAVRSRRWDAILAMGHDQGLGPLKAVDFERAVNVTLGLPIPRTSPDHGVAYDIAGKGRADPTSLIEALLLAARMARPG
ncbi:MAG: 4-hydroxythreonine-4-phosphate dehydrogenase PdxA [Myxococcales bacterium]